MEKKYELFHKTLNALGETGILSDIILAGSWCLYFYRIMFGHDAEIPAVRTLDLDLLIPNPPNICHRADIPAILSGLGYLEEFSHLSGFSKFIHPDLEVEFLITKKGRGKDGPYQIKELKVNAQGMRYMNLLQEHILKVPYEGFLINIPEPWAFVFNKLITSGRRSSPEKAKKDLETAVGLGEYLVTIHDQKAIMISIFSNLPLKWRKTIQKIIEKYSHSLYETLCSI